MTTEPNLNSILFATYAVKREGKRLRTSGPVQPFIDYFVPRFPEVYVLEQPLPESEDLLPTLEIYRGGALAETRRLPRWLRPWWHVSARRKARSGTILRLKLRDAISLAWAAFGVARRPFDLVIGMESVNAAGAVCLRRLGKAQRAIYYLFDFTPTRYAGALMNRAYLALDRFCCQRCDLVWNISEAYARAREEELGYPPEKLAPQVTVNYGVNLDAIEFPPEESIDRRRLVFAGTVNRENGIDILMEAFPLVLREEPETTLLILGGGRMLEEVRGWAEKTELGGAVNVAGMVAEQRELTRKLAAAGIALAPYPDYPQSTKKYGDVMKIRDYLACRLPVVTTDVPPISARIAELPAGAVSSPNPGDFARAILSLLRDSELYRTCRRHARELAEENTWEKNFSRAISLIQ